MRRCRRCWLPFPTIAALEEHKCLLAPAPSAPTTASTTPPGSEDARAYRCPPCSVGCHQGCLSAGMPTACDCARREHPVEAVA